MGYARRKVKIDSAKFLAWMEKNGYTREHIGRCINRSGQYVSDAIRLGHMSESIYEFFLSCFGLEPGTFLDKNTEPKEDFVKPEQTSNTPHEHPNEYWLRLKYSPSVAKVQIMFGDEVIIGGVSKIKGNTQLDFAQAISYAAHMCYKLIEQKVLEEQGK